MKERRSKRNRTTDSKKNEKETTNDKENSEYEQTSNPSDSDGNDSVEKVQKKIPRRGQRRSSRKLNMKSLCELSDNEDDDTGELSEDNTPKRETGRKSTGSSKSRKTTADEDEINGEKVQGKRDLRTSTKTVENETDDGNENKEDEDEQVDEEPERPSKLTKKGSRRKTSVRASEAKKLKVNESEKNGESGTGTEETYNSTKSKKNETKKAKNKVSEAKEDNEDEEEAGPEEYEVEKLVDIYFKRNGTREFLVRWKGYTSKDDTWEPEKHLNCKELIDAFLEKCEQARNIPMREMRTDRRKTERYMVNEKLAGRKLSARLRRKPRKTYFDEE